MDRKTFMIGSLLAGLAVLGGCATVHTVSSNVAS